MQALSKIMDVEKELTDEDKRARIEIIHKIVAKAQSIITRQVKF